jgi:hypothetical protein
MFQPISRRIEMFVAGLAVGPAIGLLAGDFLFRSRAIGPKWGAVVTALVCFALLVAPVADEGLRIGLVFGIVLGVLLTLTPMTMSAAREQ